MGGTWRFGAFSSSLPLFFCCFLKEVPLRCCLRLQAPLPAPCPSGGLEYFGGFTSLFFPPAPPPRLSGAVPGMRGVVTVGRGVPQTPASPTGPDPGSGSQEQPGERAHPCGMVSWESGDPWGGPRHAGSEGKHCLAGRAEPREAMAAPPTHATSLPGVLWPRSCFSLGQAGLNTTTQNPQAGCEPPQAGVASRCSPTSPSSVASPGSPLHPAPGCIQPCSPGDAGGPEGGGRSEGASCSAGSR